MFTLKLGAVSEVEFLYSRYFQIYEKFTIYRFLFHVRENRIEVQQQEADVTAVTQSIMLRNHSFQYRTNTTRRSDISLNVSVLQKKR